MEQTQITQRCYSTTVEDVVNYLLELSVTEKGELPVDRVFVYSIVDSTDPSKDAFLYVCNVQQLQELEDDRYTAISKAQNLYLSPYAEFRYADIETAIAARETIFGRINDLVNTWITYRDSYAVNDQTIKYLPVSDPNFEQQLIDAYKEAKDNTSIAQDAYDDAVSQYDAALIDLDHAKEIRNIYAGCKQYCTDVFGISGSSLAHYIDLVVAGGEPVDAYNYRTVSGGLNDQIVAACGDIATRYSTASQEVTTAENNLSTTTQGKIEAGAALKSARKLEDEALAAVLSVCQDFDPNSV